MKEFLEGRSVKNTIVGRFGEVDGELVLGAGSRLGSLQKFTEKEKKKEAS